MIAVPQVWVVPTGPWPDPGLPLAAFGALATFSTILVLAIVIVGLFADRRYGQQIRRVLPGGPARRTNLRPAA